MDKKLNNQTFIWWKEHKLWTSSELLEMLDLYFQSKIFEARKFSFTEKLAYIYLTFY